MFCQQTGSSGAGNNINDQINYGNVGGGGSTTNPGGGAGCGFATSTAIKNGKTSNDVTDPCPPTPDLPYLAEMLDTTGLSRFPKLKELAADLPGFLKKYPNITKAIAYYTGFTEAQVTAMMKPGAGPKITVVPNLVSSNGTYSVGEYNPETRELRISESFALGLQVVTSPNAQQATALLLAITAMHEFIHYGRDANHLTYNATDIHGYNVEAGWEFEYNISYQYNTGITASNAFTWVKFYPYNFDLQ